MFPHAVRTF